MNIDWKFVTYIFLQCIFVYYIVLHGSYLAFIFIGARHQKRYHQGIQFGEFKRISESTFSIPATVVIPAYNEEKLIVTTALNVLQLNYPEFEVIIVNDGSKDKTLELLKAKFQLQEIDYVFKKNFETKPVKKVYRSNTYPNLIVVDKENGGRADANNTAVNYSKYPIICQIDADCVLESDALLQMIRPFLIDPEVVAATSIIRPSNGITVDANGRIIDRGLPKTILGMFQAVEYLRAFQWSRSGLAELGSILCMSGAYTVVRKDVFIKVGGADTTAIVDDFELTVSVQRYIQEHKDAAKMRIAYVPDPGCYTEVPEDLKSFASQRNFWQRTIIESLVKNRDMALNPKYGVVGMFAIPYYFLFEGLAPLIEISALVLAPFAYFMGLASLQEILTLLIFGILLGTFVSLCAVILHMSSRMREIKTSGLLKLLAACYFENLGFHQFHLLCRFKGIIDLVLFKKTTHAPMRRIGYQINNPK